MSVDHVESTIIPKVSVERPMPYTTEDAAVCVAYMKHQHEMYRIRIDSLGSSANAAMIRLVMIGFFERRPYDITDLAHDLSMSRQSVLRRLDEFTTLGLMVIERTPVHAYVHPTQHLIDYTTASVPPLVHKGFRAYSNMHHKLMRQGQWAAMMKRIVPLIIGAAVLTMVFDTRPMAIEKLTGTFPVTMDMRL